MRLKIKLILGVFIIFFCYPTSQTNAEFKVAVLVPLTGDLAACGNAVKNGILMAEENAKSPKSSIKFILEDTQYNPTLSLSAFNKVITTDKVNLVMTWGDHPSTVIAPVAHRMKIPIVAIFDNPEISKRYPYLIRFINSYFDNARILIDHLKSSGAHKIGIIMTEDPYYRNLLNGMQHFKGEDQSLVVTESVNYQENDFKSIISRLKKSNYEALGVFLMPGQISTFYNQASSQGYKLPTFGADVFESRDEISKAKGNMDGAVYVQNIVNGEFQKNYRKKYGNDEQIGYAANAYEFAEMVHSLFKDTTTISADDVLKKIKTYSRNDLDALDKIKFEYENGDNSFEFPLGLKRINGNLITVERYYW